MSKPELEFIVVGVIEGPGFKVLGRCGDVPIHVGDLFDAVFRYRPRRTHEELGTEPIREVEKTTAIRVTGIHALNRPLMTMGQGMTGSLMLEGDGLQYLAAGWILGRRSAGPSAVDQESEAASATV